jgi:hypothetical protein
VFWSPGRHDAAYRPLTDDDRRRLEEELTRHGRARLLGSPGSGGDEGRA